MYMLKSLLTVENPLCTGLSLGLLLLEVNEASTIFKHRQQFSL
jgi:hypothetical protein